MNIIITKTLSTLATFTVLITTIFAQDCVDFFPMNKNQSWEIAQYNAKGKLQNTSKNEVIDKKITDKTITSTIKMSIFDAKGKNETTNEFEVSCTGKIFTMAIKAMIPQQAISGFESMDVKIDAKDLEMPTTMIPGTSLPDGNLNMSASMNGISVMNMTVKITNRKIESKETITIESGTYECFKITETSELKMGFMNTTSSSIQWFAPKYGVVKSEFYDKNGKLDSYSVMTKFN